MSERDHMRKIFGFHPPLSSQPLTVRCTRCGGDGKLRSHDPDGDGSPNLYSDCDRCGGSGRIIPATPQPLT